MPKQKATFRSISNEIKLLIKYHPKGSCLRRPLYHW